VAFTLSATAADALSTVAGAEWFDGADPGAGHGTAMTVTGNALSASINTAGLAAGAHTLRARARDALGNWGTTASVTVNVVPNAIFADAFNSRDTSAWSASERSFHAKFDFTVGNFNAGTRIVDLFQARGTAGTSVLTVQYQRSGTANQFRLAVLTAGVWSYTGWVTVSGSTVTIRVDWGSAVSGSATLRVGTATVGTVNGNTSAYTVESSAMGVVAATGTGAPTGSATFDNYASTRFTAP
jgi:hypothetical protein